MPIMIMYSSGERGAKLRETQTHSRECKSEYRVDLGVFAVAVLAPKSAAIEQATQYLENKRHFGMKQFQEPLLAVVSEHVEEHFTPKYGGNGFAEQPEFPKLVSHFFEHPTVQPPQEVGAIICENQLSFSLVPEE